LRVQQEKKAVHRIAGGSPASALHSLGEKKRAAIASLAISDLWRSMALDIHTQLSTSRKRHQDPVAGMGDIELQMRKPFRCERRFAERIVSEPQSLGTHQAATHIGPPCEAMPWGW